MCRYQTWFPLLALIVGVADAAWADEQLKACAETGPLTVYVVRHAERAEDGSDDPGLSEDGHARAEALAVALGGVRIDSVHVTRLRRTRETAAVLVESSDVNVRTWPLTWPGVAAHIEELAEAICNDYQNQSILVVGHSNTVAAIVRAISGVVVDELTEQEFDHLFQIRLAPGAPAELLRARFGRPNPDGDSSDG